VAGKENCPGERLRCRTKCKRGKNIGLGVHSWGAHLFGFFFLRLMRSREPRPVSSLAASQARGHRSSRCRDDRAQHRSFNQSSRDDALGAGPILTRGNCGCPSHSPFDFKLGVRRIAISRHRLNVQMIEWGRARVQRHAGRSPSGVDSSCSSTPRFVFYFSAAREPVTVRGV